MTEEVFIMLLELLAENIESSAKDAHEAAEIIRRKTRELEGRASNDN